MLLCIGIKYAHFILKEPPGIHIHIIRAHLGEGDDVAHRVVLQRQGAVGGRASHTEQVKEMKKGAEPTFIPPWPRVAREQ